MFAQGHDSFLNGDKEFQEHLSAWCHVGALLVENMLHTRVLKEPTVTEFGRQGAVAICSTSRAVQCG